MLKKHGKKLLLIAAFLLATALLVGGEENPGMIAQMQEADTTGGSVPASAATVIDPGPASAVPAPVGSQQEDPSLDSWYADAGPGESVEPEPVDDSHLITSTDPILPPEPIE